LAAIALIIYAINKPQVVNCNDGPNGTNSCDEPLDDPWDDPWDDPYGPTEKKPILYLYPKTETDITVSFAHPERLTTSYPKFNDAWKVRATPEGLLTDASGNKFYALYWEAESNFRPDQSTAFYVEKDDAIDFLQDKLSEIGLNDHERNEFMLYWLPILEENEKSLVRFAYTEELQADNAVKISPAPDSFLRVHIYVEKVSANPNLPEPTLSHFERKGFTAVEWGGVTD
jgi:hypothetical protein